MLKERCGKDCVVIRNKDEYYSLLPVSTRYKHHVVNPRISDDTIFVINRKDTTQLCDLRYKYR